MHENERCAGWKDLLVRLRPKDHLVQLYDDDDALAARAALYVRDGLDREEAAVAVASAPHREAICRRLASDGLDVEREMRSSRLQFLDVDETLSRIMVDGRPDADRFLAVLQPLLEEAPSKAGLRGVRAYGEMVDRLWSEGQPAAALHLEHLWHRLLRHCAIPLLCSYRMNILDRPFREECFQSVLSVHTHLVPVGEDDSLDRRFRAAMDGVLGRENADALRPLIAAAQYPRVRLAPAEAAVVWVSRTLPGRCEEIFRAAREGRGDREPSALQPASPRGLVLLVEDDPNDRLILEHAFERSVPGLRVRAVMDGEEAMAYLAGQGAAADRSANPLPEVVLLDLRLPRKSGLEVLEWIREQPALERLPVLVLSSSQERGDIDLAYALGANSFLIKQADIQAVRAIARGIGAYAALAAR